MLITANILNTRMTVDVHWFMYRPLDEQSLIDMTICDSGELKNLSQIEIDTVEEFIISLIERNTNEFT